MARRPSMATLRLFTQVASMRSFSETARTANISQPALSRTIRILEEDLGARLFDRNTRSVSLTTAGETLLPVVERLIADFDDAFAEVSQSFEGKRGRVVLGILPSIAASKLPPILARFRKTHPHVEVTLRDNLSGSLYQSMRERQVDLALTTPSEDNSGEFDFEPMMTDGCVLVCSADSELNDQRMATWSIFQDHPFIAMAPRSSVRILTDAAFIRARLTVKPLYECTQLATVGALIAGGLGITALPLSTIAMLDSYDLGWRPLEQPRAERVIGLARLAERSLSPAAEALRRYLLMMQHS